MKFIKYFLLIFVIGCTKPAANENMSLYNKTLSTLGAGTSQALSGDISYSQSASVSIWQMFDSSNLLIAKADYIEFHLSDTNSNKITNQDEVKTVDGSDNLAIKSLYTNNLLTKEYRSWPGVADTIQLKQWNNSRDNYYYKVIVRNVPVKMFFTWQMDAFNFYLFNQDENKYYRLPTGNQTLWIPFKASTNTKNWQLIIQKVF